MDRQPETSVGQVLLDESPKLRAVIRGLVKQQHERADIFQETVAAVIERGQQETICNPLAYAITVARHFAYKMHCKITSSLDDEPEIADEQADPEQDYLAGENVARLQQALAMLPSLRREVFIRRRLHQQSREQIAKDLGISEEAVKKHITRALAQLALYLDD
ncbi:sigma-70 family RNA polymerase sigma factor [Chromatiaceae bacterium AAb-1]|nr:sigma-70 family RNA polymerase sigma factor [Chromatiaceae bacterium AAb-1]